MKITISLIIIFIFCHYAYCRNEAQTGFYLQDENVVLKEDGSITINIISNTDQELKVSLYKTRVQDFISEMVELILVKDDSLSSELRAFFNSERFGRFDALLKNEPEAYSHVLEDPGMLVYGPASLHLKAGGRNPQSITIRNIVPDFYILVLEDATGKRTCNLFRPQPIVIWQSHVGERSIIHVAQATTGEPLVDHPIQIAVYGKEAKTVRHEGNTNTSGSFTVPDLVNHETKFRSHLNPQYLVIVPTNSGNIYDNILTDHFEASGRYDKEISQFMDRDAQNNRTILNRLGCAFRQADSSDYPFSVQSEQQLYASTRKKSLRMTNTSDEKLYISLLVHADKNSEHLFEIAPHQTTDFTLPDVMTSSLEIVTVLHGKTYRKFIPTPSLFEELSGMSIVPQFHGSKLVGVSLSMPSGTRLPDNFSASYVATIGKYPYLALLPFNFLKIPDKELFHNSPYDNRIEMLNQKSLCPKIDPLESYSFFYDSGFVPYRITSTPKATWTQAPGRVAHSQLYAPGKIEILFDNRPMETPVWFNCVIYDGDAEHVILYSLHIMPPGTVHNNVSSENVNGAEI